MSVQADDVERFEALLAQRMGFAFGAAQRPNLKGVLETRLAARRVSCQGYLDELGKGYGYDEEIGALASVLTVPETYFFRDARQLHAFRDVILGTGREEPLRVLSAGCASGEEAYTIAMLVRGLLPGQRLSVDALDANSDALERALAGTYSRWSLRETEAPERARWFRPLRDRFALEEGVKQDVRFQACNLVEFSPATLRLQRYDAIFCRNVLMYLTPSSAQRVVAQLTALLVPGGYLFLGHAETLRNLSEAYELCHSHETFYYRLRRPEQGALRTPWVVDRSPVLSSWHQVIAEASARVGALAASRTAGARELEQVPPAASGMQQSLSLLRQERFDEALSAIRGSSERRRDDADALMLEATLLAQSGRFAEAELACSALLAQNDFDPTAHFVLALCREGVGDLEGAVYQHQLACHLDRGFAMPHLHLGVLKRRRAEYAAAAAELALAESLLRREELTRVLLFGGGFGRDALLSLCRAELRACEEAGHG